MLEMLETLVAGYEQVRRLSPTTQRRVLALGSRLERLVGDVRPLKKGAKR